MRRLSSFARVALAISLIVAAWCLPLGPRLVAVTIVLAALCLRNPRLALAASITALSFTAFYAIAWLAIWVLTSRGIGVPIDVLTRLVGAVVASFLSSTIVRGIDVVNVFGVNRLSLAMVVAATLIKTLPRFSELATIVKRNYGWWAMFLRAPQVLGILLVEKSVEYVESLCLKIPELCLGGPDQPLHSAAIAAVSGVNKCGEEVLSASSGSSR